MLCLFYCQHLPLTHCTVAQSQAPPCPAVPLSQHRCSSAGSLGHPHCVICSPLTGTVAARLPGSESSSVSHHSISNCPVLHWLKVKFNVLKLFYLDIPLALNLKINYAVCLLMKIVSLSLILPGIRSSPHPPCKATKDQVLSLVHLLSISKAIFLAQIWVAWALVSPTLPTVFLYSAFVVEPQT